MMSLDMNLEIDSRKEFLLVAANQLQHNAGWGGDGGGGGEVQVNPHLPE